MQRTLFEWTQDGRGHAADVVVVNAFANEKPPPWKTFLVKQTDTCGEVVNTLPASGLREQFITKNTKRNFRRYRLQLNLREFTNERAEARSAGLDVLLLAHRLITVLIVFA